MVSRIGFITLHLISLVSSRFISTSSPPTSLMASWQVSCWRLKSLIAHSAMIVAVWLPLCNEVINWRLWSDSWKHRASFINEAKIVEYISKIDWKLLKRVWVTGACEGEEMCPKPVLQWISSSSKTLFLSNVYATNPSIHPLTISVSTSRR